ncbi:Signal transduction response regulator / Disease resistance domain-containing protein [Alloactinosynnema sp. L-07]|uniref:helix-turn-helix transcriptional regulator n=1 Tax=Alloactinosynnema sp. L-07 TaxID=1653480 RepID=UPI00065EFF1D|nr:LuxR C-terminal-related transcriptional regulator [Alloactinosynnema sp. L-07]CRK56577.1 Signal transduction response regulator / Disease resistance domain-containing protein [Alloactinosynnema sp. L-07]
MLGYQGPPAELTSFIGRQTELQAVAGVLATARMVTLAGPGGCGKTRLAARVASERDGAWVDLAATADPATVAPLVATALGVPHAGDGTVATLAAQLGGESVLVCVDNCEHVLGAAAEVVSQLLARCPGVTVLATSREPLRVAGEVVWRVPPLTAADSLALFHARSGQTSEDDAIRSACARLEGMPLAVELAAAWTGALSPREILDGLDDRFRLLIRGPHGVAARHQTLSASMAWSYDLLDAEDRALFDRLSVFHGGFTAAAAEGVCGRPVLLGLRSLIDKSLLVADTTGEVTRYRMLETVHEYAKSRLADPDAVRDRHLEVFAAVAASARPLLDSDKDSWRVLIGADYQNFRAAVDWGLSRVDGCRLAADLAWYWHFSRHGGEGLSLLRRAVDACPERTALRARLLTGLALVGDTAGSPEYAAAAEAAAIAREVGDDETAALALSLSAVGALATGFDAAWALAEESDAAAGHTGFAHDAAMVLHGLVCHLRDDHARAIPLLEAAVAGLLPRGDRGVGATALGFLATSVAHTGDLDHARALAEQAVEVATPLGDYHRVGSARAVLAHVHTLAGDLERAWAAVEPVRAVAEAGGVFIPGLAQRIAALHRAGGDQDAAAAWFTRDLPHPAARVGLASVLRDPEAARQHAAEALDQARAMGMPGFAADALTVQATVDASVDLHHEALALRWEHGLRLACVASLEALADLTADDRLRDQAMPLDDRVAYARRSRGKRSRPTSGWASLTPTELSVVELAVEGLNNPDIAGKLYMSRATVKTHLSHVYAKLAIANRTQLAAAHRDHTR